MLLNLPCGFISLQNLPTATPFLNTIVHQSLVRLLYDIYSKHQRYVYMVQSFQLIPTCALGEREKEKEERASRSRPFFRLARGIPENYSLRRNFLPSREAERVRELNGKRQFW